MQASNLGPRVPPFLSVPRSVRTNTFASRLIATLCLGGTDLLLPGYKVYAANGGPSAAMQMTMPAVISDHFACCQGSAVHESFTFNLDLGPHRSSVKTSSLRGWVCARAGSPSSNLGMQASLGLCAVDDHLARCLAYPRRRLALGPNH